MPTPPFHTQGQAASRTSLPPIHTENTLHNHHPQTRSTNSHLPHATTPHNIHRLLTLFSCRPPSSMAITPCSQLKRSTTAQPHVPRPSLQASSPQPARLNPDLYQPPREKNTAQRRS